LKELWNNKRMYIFLMYMFNILFFSYQTVLYCRKIKVKILFIYIFIYFENFLIEFPNYTIKKKSIYRIKVLIAEFRHNKVFSSINTFLFNNELNMSFHFTNKVAIKRNKVQ
jgi:hypothetical protein